MKQLRVTQEILGRVLNCDRSVVSRIIGGTQVLGLNQVLPLARALEVSPFEILYRAGMWDDPDTPGGAEREALIGLFEQVPAPKQPAFIDGAHALARLAAAAEAQAPPPPPAAASLPSPDLSERYQTHANVGHAAAKRFHRKKGQ